jgi:hypothetical protein
MSSHLGRKVLIEALTTSVPMHEYVRMSHTQPKGT